ncbi:class I SAM-dependent methyltransferase [Flindersiella endophytica]
MSAPRTYFEIGINDGRSLTLSRVPSVAVDPAFKVNTELRCDLHMVKATSDDFFKRDKPFEHLGDDPRVDLAFIDGMHLFEFVLRDFINAEKYADWSTVIVFDDQLPRNVDEAARKRHTTAWTGDVYKMIPVLQRYRPDLRVAVFDTTPTGVMAVFGADPGNTVLSDKYDEIMDTYLLKDPQQVPEELLTRSCAMDPAVFFEAPFWASLAASRKDESSSYGREEFLADVDKALADLPKPELAEWLPDPSAGRDAEFDPSITAGEAADVGRVVQNRKAASAPAPAKSMATNRPPNDIFRKLARRAPFLRRLPGARALVRALR